MARFLLDQYWKMGRGMGIFCISFILAFLSQSVSSATSPECSVDFYENILECKFVGADGRSMNEVIQQTPFVRELDFGRIINYSFTQLAPSAVTLRLNNMQGTVRIEEGLFSQMPNLRNLIIEDNWEIPNPDDWPYLDVVDSEFKHMPNLHTLTIHECKFSPSTIKGLVHLKDKLEVLDLRNAMPGREIFQAISEFTKLFNVEIADQTCADHSFPMSIFKKSVASLTYLEGRQCRLPVITKDMLAGMHNLESFKWQSGGIERIEDGAFDDLEKLGSLILTGNNIRRLPNGLFNKTRKISVIDVMGNKIENLSRDNFTSIDEPEKFLYYE